MIRSKLSFSVLDFGARGCFDAIFFSSSRLILSLCETSLVFLLLRK